jgi:hypothetical protein
MSAVCGPHTDDAGQVMHVKGDLAHVRGMQLWELSKVSRELPDQADEFLFSVLEAELRHLPSVSWLSAMPEVMRPWQVARHFRFVCCLPRERAE